MSKLTAEVVVNSVSPVTWLVAIAALAVLLSLSAFFSASEAALFSLTASQRSQLNASRRDRSIVELLNQPSHLLSCILMCNLVVNITFFACANVISSWLLRIETWSGFSLFFGFAIVGIVILFGELLPKSVGVLAPLRISRLVSIPMSIALTAVRPVAVGMHAVNDVCRRLILPGLVAESHLETTDLERAIELSETDSRMIDLEKGILQNILQLSEIQSSEWMHPKSQFATLTLPLSKEQLREWLEEENEIKLDERPRLVLVLSKTDGEVSSTTTWEQVRQAHSGRTAPITVPAVFVPWCSNLASVFQTLLKTENQVAIVVNERGDTIGVLFLDDIVEAVFASPSAGIQAMGRALFAKTGEAKWEVTGATRVKKLERALGIKLPESRDATIAGVIQSQLRRIAQVDDRVEWGPFTLVVKEVLRRGEMFVEITSSEVDIAEETSGGIA
ncbi:MAG: CNNM domain-containing protein [Pirellula sp.]